MTFYVFQVWVQPRLSISHLLPSKFVCFYPQFVVVNVNIVGNPVLRFPAQVLVHVE